MYGEYVSSFINFFQCRSYYTDLDGKQVLFLDLIERTWYIFIGKSQYGEEIYVMKIIRTASQNKIILSRREWENIGKRAGWLFLEADNRGPIPIGEIEKRLQAIGWRTWMTGDNELRAADPLKNCAPISISVHNYEEDHRTWKNVRGDILRCNRELDFIFNAKFVIPSNFNIATQRRRTPEEQKANRVVKVLPFHSLPPDILTKRLVWDSGEWKKPVNIGYNPNVIAFRDGSSTTYKINEPIKVTTLD